MAGVLGHDGGIEVEPGEIRWWTFAGGRINATLRYALEAVGGDWKVIPDNFLIKVRGEELRPDSSRRPSSASRSSTSGKTRLWAEVAESLPNYRLSKFQPLMPPWVEREVVASYLLDVAGAWHWLSETEASGLERIPQAIRAPSSEDDQRLARLDRAKPIPEAPVLSRGDNAPPLVWVRTEEELHQAVETLLSESQVGLDVETTLASRALCLVQIAASERTFLIDALEVPELDPLASIFGSGEIRKIIHNAAFEREVLGRYGLELEGVVDTLELSREVRGRAIEGGHSLRAVCARELGLALDKSEQTSDWTERPLSPGQVEYAALDAEVLLPLLERLAGASL